MTTPARRPPLLLRVYAFLVFPWSAKGSLVWWWRMHVNIHGGYRVDPDCRYCDVRESRGGS